MKYIFFMKFLIILLIFVPHVQGSQITLTKLEQYANTLNELPPLDNEDFLNPVYVNYQASKIPNFWQSLARNFNHSYFLWSKEKFINVMRQTLREMSFINQDHFVIKVKAGDQFVVWGDIHGAFHSIVRDLRQLQKKGFLDENLKITNKNIKFIFMGNIIDRSAYSLDTLSLILTLMHQNPDKIIYMRGSHEDNRNWQNYDFEKEVATRLKVTVLSDPFFNSVLEFFSKLPSKIFIQLEDKNPQTLAFNSLYKTSVSSLLDIEPSINILINNQSRSRIYQTTQGLNLLPQEQGIQTWTLFSSPTLTFQKLYNFYNDSFSIIKIGSEISSSTVTQFIRDIRHKSHDFSETVYYLLSGQKVQRQEQPLTEWLNLTIGCTLDLSESTRVLGERIKAGIDLRIRKLNREGGIRGKLLKVYFQNDQSDASLALNNVMHLINQYHSNVVACSLGAKITKSLIPLTQDRKILLLFPYTGSNAIRHKELTYVINNRASHAEEAQALVKYAKETRLKQRFAFFYQEDSYGKEALKAAKEMLQQKYNISDDHICEASYMQNSLNVDKAADIIKAFTPDVLFLFSTLEPSKELINKLDISLLNNVSLMGISFLSDRFRDFISPKNASKSSTNGLEFVISRVVPNPNYDRRKIIAEYRDEIDRIYPGSRYDVDSLEGYINTSILIDTLENLSSPLQLEDIIQAMESRKNYNFKDLSLTFNPETRSFSEQVWLDTGEKDWILINKN